MSSTVHSHLVKSRMDLEERKVLSRSSLRSGPRKPEESELSPEGGGGGREGEEGERDGLTVTNTQG